MYHFSAQTISRSDGRTSVRAAAYRAGEKFVDTRTGEVCDYSKKKGVLSGAVFLPGGATFDRAALWNAIEHHHKRGDAVVARELNVALPIELTPEQREALAFEYAESVANRYGVAVDVNLHEPDVVTDKMLEVDPGRFFMIDPDTGRRHNGNWHFHLMLSACYVDADGNMGKKCVELDPIHMQRINSQRKKDGLEPLLNAVEAERALWADMCNRHLEQAGLDVRVDHRSLADQGIVDREPTIHHGPAARGREAKTGKKSTMRLKDEAKQAEFQPQLAELAAAAAALKIAEAEAFAAKQALTDELEADDAARRKERLAARAQAQTTPPRLAGHSTKGKASPSKQQPLPAQPQAVVPAQRTIKELDSAWGKSKIQLDGLNGRLNKEMEMLRRLGERVKAPTILAKQKPLLAWVDKHVTRVREFEAARADAEAARLATPHVKAEITRLKPMAKEAETRTTALFEQLKEATNKAREAYFAAQDQQRLVEQQQAPKLANTYATAERQTNISREK